MLLNTISICLIRLLIFIYSIAPTVNLEMKSKIEGGTIFICTQTASLNGIVSSDGAVDYSGLD